MFNLDANQESSDDVSAYIRYLASEVRSQSQCEGFVFAVGSFSSKANRKRPRCSIDVSAEIVLRALNRLAALPPSDTSIEPSLLFDKDYISDECFLKARIRDLIGLEIRHVKLNAAHIYASCAHLGFIRFITR